MLWYRPYWRTVLNYCLWSDKRKSDKMISFSDVNASQVDKTLLYVSVIKVLN